MLLNEVITIIPEGIYLYQISRVANKITLLGYAESNTDISNFMRSIEASIWTKDPGLIEIKKRSDADSSDENEFKLSFILKSRTMLAKKL